MALIYLFIISVSDSATALWNATLGATAPLGHDTSAYSATALWSALAHPAPCLIGPSRPSQATISI
jgi:hypothetical protein